MSFARAGAPVPSSVSLGSVVVSLMVWLLVTDVSDLDVEPAAVQ